MADAKRMSGLSVQYEVPDSMRLTFADHSVVTTTDNEVIVSFFQTFIPVVVSNATTVPAICVARMVVTPAKARELLVALGSAIEGHFGEGTK